jgi:hypothetical protein
VGGTAHTHVNHQSQLGLVGRVRQRVVSQ